MQRKSENVFIIDSPRLFSFGQDCLIRAIRNRSFDDDDEEELFLSIRPNRKLFHLAKSRGGREMQTQKIKYHDARVKLGGERESRLG